MSISLNLDSDTEARLNRLAESRRSPREAILCEALDQYLQGEERPEPTAEGQHPSGQSWPRRNPVGGIITPV